MYSGRGERRNSFSPLAIPLESSISLYRCVADLAGNTSIGGGGRIEGRRGEGNAAMLRFYDVSFIFRDNRSAQFPITLFISQNSFSPAGRPPVCCISVCLSVFACFPVAGELFFLLLCAVQSKTFVTFACLSDGNGVQRKDFLTTNRVWVRNCVL